MNDEKETTQAEAEKKQPDPDEGRPTGARAWAGWIFVLAYSFAFGIPIYMQDPQIWIFLLVGPLVLGLVLSGILFTPLGIIVAAVMVVWLSIENSPGNALLAIGAMYAIAIVGNVITIKLIWGGKFPKVFKTKTINILGQEPFSESYRVGLYGNFYDLHWGGTDNDYSIQVMDDSMLSAPPKRLKVLANELMDVEWEPNLATIYERLLNRLNRTLKETLGVTTELLDQGDYPRGRHVTMKTDMKRNRRMAKIEKESGVTAKAILDIHPEVRVPPDDSWSDFTANLTGRIGLRWNLMIVRLIDKRELLFMNSGTINHEVKIRAGESLPERALKAMDAASLEVSREMERLIAEKDSAVETLPTEAGAE